MKPSKEEIERVDHIHRQLEFATKSGACSWSSRWQGTTLVMWRQSALFLTATRAAVPQHRERPNNEAACSSYQGSDLDLERQYEAWTQQRPENAAACDRNEAALRREQTLSRKHSKIDPRPGIDDVGGFSSASWEE